MADDVAAPLPEVDLLHGSTITVELDIAGATITALNVHGFESNDGTDTAPETLSPVTGAYLTA